LGAVTGKTLPEVGGSADFPSECIVTGIFRPKSQQFIIPRGSAQIESGDRVFLVATRPDLKQASRFLHRH